MRHGRPTLWRAGWLSRAGFEAWCAAYDAAGLGSDAAPPAGIVRLARDAALVVSSDLRRARESAAALRPGAPNVIWPLLREVDLPAAAFTPALRLPLTGWLVVARVGWTTAWLASDEPRAAARTRAVAAADALEAAARGGAVVAVGHGVFHGMTAAVLRARGWRGPPWWAGRYWATTTLSRDP